MNAAKEHAVNVLIVEDSELVYQHLRVMLSEIPGVKLAGRAADEQGAIKAMDSLLPDVVILDLHLHEGSGFNVLADIKERHAATKVIVLSNYASDSYIRFCRELGADHFFDKSFQFELVGAMLELMSSCGGLIEESDHTQQQSSAICTLNREVI